ncbi:MAG: gamma-glutamyltransferase [Fuerstiella sp.]
MIIANSCRKRTELTSRSTLSGSFRNVPGWTHPARIVRRFTALAMMLITLPSTTVIAQHQQPSFAHGVVAADHPAASEAGAEMLRRGGNVVDAAVATSFALSVVRPASCGIGGGGFMVIWDAERQTSVALDYRERAPAAASREMFKHLGSNDVRESASVRGGKANAIPGTVAGLCYAAQKYGTLPLSTLLQPAIDLAKNGVAIDEHDISIQESTLAKFKTYANYSVDYALLKKQYLNDGVPWKSGDRFYSPQLPALLKIAEFGAAGFYEGKVALAITAASQKLGGLLTLEDLKSTAPVVRVPLLDEYRGKQLITMPPASSGGVALIQTIQALEFWEESNGKNLRELGHNSADYVHVVTEAMKHAFADRAEYLGDTDFTDVPIQRLISADYAKQIASRINMQKTLPDASYGRFFAGEDGGTSHFSVIDTKGNAVACTETINLTFGSFVVVPEYGIILNNQIDDFAARSGEPNAFGLMQSQANSIAAGKKPLSSMTPTIIVQDGKAIYATGASGGPRIISATIQSVLNRMVFDMSAQTAVSSSRFHHQWFPNELRLENSLHKLVAESLANRGHKVVRSESLAAAQAAATSHTSVQGGSDPRKHGAPAGF